MPDYSRYQFVKVEVANKVATVTLNRPEAMNATNPQMHGELEQIWVDLAEDAAVNAILLTGAGRAFSAGGDVKAMAARYGTEEGKQRTLTLPSGARRLIQNMLDVGQPIIGAINGDAMGLGATIALFCDVIVASETARIADTHVKVGIVAGDGGAVIWPLLIGPARAKEFLMRGKIINGAEAAQMGLVNYAVPTEAVLPKAREIAQELADGATWAIRWSKLSVNKWLKDQVNLILDASLAYEMLTFHTDDHREAARAFVDKRPPKFGGR
ncbi:MAG: enoyl-CoA hydratase/isomerase family protein [Betaproteobacteria bacterium]|nr:enoyl-CoA hydratase/isomerase family protein [Betaproteobacteria bacterium]